MVAPLTRSEYRRSAATVVAVDCAARVAPIDDALRDDYARVLLSAYRGTVDDEGETEVEALAAIDHYLRYVDRGTSVVLTVDGAVAAFAWVVTVGDMNYIDPVVVTSEHKRCGLGRAAVSAALQRLGLVDVGATITDGNVASERLFASLGFARVGAWPLTS